MLLGVEPAKVRPDYAKFDLADPPLVLSLAPGRAASGGNLNHAGLRVRNAEELVEIQRRLEAAGMPTQREEGVECCYARQTKFWIADPDGALWEIYVFHEDIDVHGKSSVQAGRAGAGAGGALGIEDHPAAYRGLEVGQLLQHGGRSCDSGSRTALTRGRVSPRRAPCP